MIDPDDFIEAIAAAAYGVFFCVVGCLSLALIVGILYGACSIMALAWSTLRAMIG